MRRYAAHADGIGKQHDRCALWVKGVELHVSEAGRRTEGVTRFWRGVAGDESCGPISQERTKISDEHYMVVSLRGRLVLNQLKLEVRRFG